MEPELFYRNVTSAVRTPRFAVLIDSKHKNNWKAYVSGAIQSFSQVWGGEHFIIIPTDGEIIDDAFWRVLEAYSPDYIGRYIPSLLDLEEADPLRYEDIKSRHREGWELSEEDFEKNWSEQVRTAHLGGLGVSSKLSLELKNRLSPFYFQDHIAKENVFRDSPLGYPFTRVQDIVDTAKDRPTEVIAPLSIGDSSYRLLALSRSGSLSDTYAHTLKSKGFTVSLLPADSDSFRQRDYIAALESNEYSSSWHRALNSGSSVYPPEDFLSKLPFKLSLLHLGKFYKHETHRDWEENIRVIVGDTFEDYCLYYSLSRMHSGVYWMPDYHLNLAHRKVDANRTRSDEDVVRFTENEGIASELVNTYFKAIDFGHTSKKIEITSLSLTLRQLAYRKRWMSSICFSGSGILPHCRVVPFASLSLDCVAQVIELNNHANQQDVVFQDRHSVGRINTPKPKNFSPVNAAEHRWITSVRIDKFHPPALPFLGDSIITGMNSVQETRVANDELAYFSPNIAYFGGDIDVITVRPSINLLSSGAILNDYFKYSGYTTELSDKGSYLKDTISRFGSLEQAAAFFRSETNRRIFDQFLVTRPDRGDDEIIYLNVERRAYLGFEALRRKVGDEESTVLLLDELISKGILYRGLIFQCSRCRLSAWYDIASVGNDFTCSRCGLKQPYGHSSWKSPSEPKWYYRLAETVYLCYESSSHITALALDRLRQEAPGEFHYVSETNLINVDSDKSKQEIDVIAIVKGKIILGECKNCAVKPSDVRKYITIFSRLNIKPAQFILATTEVDVASSVRAELDKFDNHRLLTRKDLYE